MTTEQMLWRSLNRQVRRTYGPGKQEQIAWQSPLWWKLYALYLFHPYYSKVPPKHSSYAKLMLAKTYRA